MAQATALIDGNNFYASCEQSLDPALIGRPVVVLSNNDGCIVARSAEARALGIAMGTPYFKARRELEQKNVVVRSSNYALYADMSQRMMSLLEAHCEELEIYSIDEAFGRISRPAGGELQSWARQLRATVKRDLGLPIAIGLGSSKSQAKLANRLAKRIPAHAGVFDLGQCNDPDGWLETIAVEDVWGIGRKLAHWCRLRGIHNARLLRDMPSGALRAKCGVIGLRLQQDLKGYACLPMDLAPAAKITDGPRPGQPTSTKAGNLREPQFQPTDHRLDRIAPSRCHLCGARCREITQATTTNNSPHRVHKNQPFRPGILQPGGELSIGSAQQRHRRAAGRSLTDGRSYLQAPSPIR